MSATLDIHLLRTFHAVARLGRFGAAAEHLHKSAAAISVQVQRLEAIAGGRLFERDNQSVALTALGSQLLGASAELLRHHDQLLGQLQGQGLAGRIRLGVPDEYAAHVIRDILPVFARAWPNVVLEVITAPSHTLQQRLERGKLHLAVMSRVRGTEHPAAQVLAVTTPAWVGAATLACHPGKPLPVALYAADCPYRDAMLGALKGAGLSWRVVLDSPSSQAIRACVEAGLAIGLMDRGSLSEQLPLLEGFPPIQEHEVVLRRASGVAGDQAIDLLAQSLQRGFRL